jgi:hypothetical protein
MEQEAAICAYAIMSNHYHLVVHVDQQRAKSWSHREVVDRWCALFSKPTLVDRWQQGLCGDAEREIAEGIVELWRRRLCDVSWYMRCLNEHLARRANAEDLCTGRFWAGSCSMHRRHSLHPCRSEVGSNRKPCSMKQDCSPRWPMWISIQSVPESPKRRKLQNSLRSTIASGGSLSIRIPKRRKRATCRF